MPESRDDWFSRMKGVEREYQSVEAAVEALIDAAQVDPTALRSDRLRPSDLLQAQSNLEATYAIRLFAVFEAGLRSYWETIRGTKPASKDLIDGLAARRVVPEQTLGDVHAVRHYRNSIVHELDEQVPVLPINVVRRRLSLFFSRLPLQW